MPLRPAKSAATARTAAQQAEQDAINAAEAAAQAEFSANYAYTSTAKAKNLASDNARDDATQPPAKARHRSRKCGNSRRGTGSLSCASLGFKT